MAKRKRIQFVKRERAVVIISLEFEVNYNIAYKAYQAAKKYCDVFKDKSVLEETEHILNLQKLTR